MPHLSTPPDASHAYQEQLATFVGELEALVAKHDDEKLLTRAVAAHLRKVLASGLDLPVSVTRPDTERYVMYPLHVDPAGRFSIASAVWNVGQGTPVHGHETWGVVGIHAGIEHEIAYEKPTEPGHLIPRVHDFAWEPGQVTVCCTTDDDVHQVCCGSDEPCVGIHVYGADIGTLERRSYDPTTGTVSWFISRWTEPAPS